MERCVQKVMAGNSKLKKSNAIAICHTQLMGKEDLESKIEEAVWDTEYINNLPDSAFAYISPGGTKDKEGKTKPRSLRHLPYKDKEGNVDKPHLRNALARLPQTNISPEAKKSALRKLMGSSKKTGIKTSKK